MSATTTAKRGPKPVKTNRTVLKLRKIKRATSRELKVTTAFIATLEDKGLVHVVDQAEPRGRGTKNRKGRKANVYALTRKGAGKALSLQRAA